jgi:hypothetical protein
MKTVTVRVPSGFTAGNLAIPLGKQLLQDPLLRKSPRSSDATPTLAKTPPGDLDTTVSQLREMYRSSPFQGRCKIGSARDVHRRFP